MPRGVGCFIALFQVDCMWNFLTLAKLFRSFVAAIKDRDFSAIVAVAKEIADLLGFAPEAKELVELIESAKAGDWAGTLRNAGEFLIVVAERFGTSTGIQILNADPLEASLAALESDAGIAAVAVKDQSNDAKLNPLPVILAIIQIIRLIRELRGKG
jgi:hypothetical protein